MVIDKSPQLKSSSSLLFIPDIFNYFLTGVMRSEFTYSTTSQLFNPRIGDWEDEIFECLTISKDIMQQIVQPGTLIGETTKNVFEKTGVKHAQVVAVSSHDTGSAVAALPTLRGNFAYISSGTWSLMGIESRKPIITDKTLRYNFTNEGGVFGTYRVLKNIAGLWLLQECQRIWAKETKYSYEKLVDLAKSAEPFVSLIDPSSPRFQNPTDMPLEIRRFCNSTNQTTPKSVKQIVRTILESLALEYLHTIKQLKKIGNINIDRIHIIGGGSRNRLLCQFTADATGLPVFAGPTEATAIGNILIQASAFERIRSHTELRKVVKNSFNIESYEPNYSLDWEHAYCNLLRLKENKRSNSCVQSF
jgi:sugar (pentulose or hexulose) kinase